MSGRNGTPLRLVSPAPVLAGGAGRPFTAQPPSAPTAPQQAQLTGQNFTKYLWITFLKDSSFMRG